MNIRWKSKGPESIEFGNLLPHEVATMEGVLNGTAWVTIRDGRAVFVPATQPLPAPVEDDMLPFWRREEPGLKLSVQTVLFPERYESQSPSFAIQHLCGYHYTPEHYRTMAARLESYGFECCRSRRGPNGQYWEIWWLSGLWCAKGALAEVVGDDERHQNSPKLIDRAVGFLCRTVSFGTLDVIVQRAAMVVD